MTAVATGRDERVVVELVARRWMFEMWSSMIGAGDHLERIEDRDRGEAEAGGVDDDAGVGVDRLVDPADELALEVGLAEDERPLAGGLRGTSPRSRRSVVRP